VKHIKNMLFRFCLFAVLWIPLTACSAGEIFVEPTSTHTRTPSPTRTPTPSETPTPTITPSPSPTITPTPQSIQMRLNLEQGEIYQIQMVNKQEITQLIEGKAEVMHQTLGLGYTYEITEVQSNGNYWITVLYNWALYEQQTSLGEISYDSSDPPDVVPPEALGYKALLGNGFSIRVTPRGRIIEVLGLEEMQSNMIDEMGITDEAMRQEMEQVLQDLYSIEAMKDQLKFLPFEYPEHPIQVGEPWSDSSEITVMVPLRIENTYTLREVEDGIGTIGASSIITPDLEAEPTDFGDFMVRYDISGSQELTITMDLEKGWQTDSIGVQKLSGDMILFVEEDQISIPIFINTETHVESYLLE
jgi:hypothetical protein